MGTTLKQTVGFEIYNVYPTFPFKKRMNIQDVIIGRVDRNVLLYGLLRRMPKKTVGLEFSSIGDGKNLVKV